MSLTLSSEAHLLQLMSWFEDEQNCTELPPPLPDCLYMVASAERVLNEPLQGKRLLQPGPE